MLFLTLLLAALAPSGPAGDPFVPLHLYNGSWNVTVQDPATGKTTTDHLVNDCASPGHFFVCQQTVNGKASALVIFVPAGTPGHYYIQSVFAEGQASGRSTLAIEGRHWAYESQEEEKGKTTWYRTTNDFTGEDRIHFESSTSADGQHWTVTRRGDEVRGSH